MRKQKSTILGVHNLWTVSAELFTRVGKTAYNSGFVHRYTFAMLGYAQVVPRLYAAFINSFFAQINGCILVFMHRFHTTNNNYSYK
jgi:hypothetical protein